MKRTFILLSVLSLMLLAAARSPRQAKPIVSILGDSYSTFEGYIPQGNVTWYFDRSDTARTDVDNVRQTWWWQLIDRGGFILGKNESFSGATVSNRGYRGADFTDRSFITRLHRIPPSDIILIFGATNDSWAGVPILGEESADSALYYFRPAMTRLLTDARNLHPGSDIYFILNTELRKDINQAVVEVCREQSVECIVLRDIEKKSGHPSRAGMEAIATQVLEAVNRPD